MLQIHLGRPTYQPDENDSFLPRNFNGWHPAMTTAEIYTSARGWWKLSRDRAEHERYAIVEAQGVCRLAIEITRWVTHPRSGRHAFEGVILEPGHPIHNRYVGRPTQAASRNPISYVEDAS